MSGFFCERGEVVKKRVLPPLFLALLSLLVAGVSPSPRACDAVCRTLSDPLRRLVVWISSLFSFPLVEAALFVFPVALALILFLPRKRGGDPLGGLLSLAASFSALFLLLSVLPARRSAPSPDPVSEEEFSAYALWLADRANREEALLPASEGEGTPPARATVPELSDAVTAALRETGLCPTEPCRVKATLFPGLFRRSGMLGYQFAFTGEAMIDPRAPAYTLPFTAAHEAAHQAGIVSEGEASFAAYVALTESHDPALRYAGWAGALDGCLPLLPAWTQNKIVSTLSPRVRADLRLYDAVLPSSGSASVVEGSNAAAIRLRGGEEPRSYDLFPRLCCRRYLALVRGDQAAARAIY